MNILTFCFRDSVCLAPFFSGTQLIYNHFFAGTQFTEIRTRFTDPVENCSNASGSRFLYDGVPTTLTRLFSDPLCRPFLRGAFRYVCHTLWSRFSRPLFFFRRRKTDAVLMRYAQQRRQLPRYYIITTSSLECIKNIV